MDTAVGSKITNQDIVPKLRKSRSIESKWGIKYYTAVKNAVFNMQPSPYMPSEPPTSLSKDMSQNDSLHVCKQCKDCFRFQSSFEEHNTRRSWILGFWCQHCFVTICTHMPTERSPCFPCLKLDRDKRSYLKSRGRRKSQKLGAVRVFYNQCQFFAHLKSHSVTSVDMSELMLMPLPTNISTEWSPQLEVVCEALMEHAFLSKVHVMDWLKDKRVENQWWQLGAAKVGSNKCNFDDPVSRVLKGYKGRIFFSSPKEHPNNSAASCTTIKNNTASPDVEIIENIENDKSKHDTSTDTLISDSDQIEREDNPCMATDIAFVDCGPASKCFEPESPVNNVPRKHTTIYIKASQDSSNTYQPASIVKLNAKRKKLKAVAANYGSSNVALSYGNTTITPKLEPKSLGAESQDRRRVVTHRPIRAKPAIKIIESNKAAIAKSKVDSLPLLLPSTAKKSICQAKEKLQQNVPTLTVNSGQKIVTFQGPTNVDFTTIINQLPPQLVSNRRIVLIGQETDATHNKQDSPVKKLIQVVPDGSLAKGMAALQTKLVPLHISGELKEVGRVKTDTGKGQKTVSKIVYRNGRKYAVKTATGLSRLANIPDLTPIASLPKQTVPESNSSTIAANSAESESTTASEKPTGLQNDVSPLTPSPSPSELSSSSSCDTQSKQTPTAAKTAPVPQPMDPTDAGANILPNPDESENLSFRKGEDDNLYLNVKLFSQKPTQNISDTCVMITKCKQEMLNEFFYLSYAELKRRIDHLQQVNDEIIAVLSFVAENVIQEKLKAVNILQRVLKHCMDKCNEDPKDPKEEDTLLNDWESEFECLKEKTECSSCGKVMKPKTYIPGFSKTAKDDNTYCFCYKHICHKCQSYQGNATRFLAHRKFHEKEGPFVCPDCSRKFSSFKLLEVHTWTVCFHTLKKRVFGCKICEIEGFRDMESVTRHFAIMHSHNRIVCGVCYLVLPSYSDYKKHVATIHPFLTSQDPIRLVLCKLGQCIVRCQNFMTHMEKHLVVNRLLWFKCPFCSFINLEAKRIMSHFQSKHLQRLPEILSLDTLMDILPPELAMNLNKTNPQVTTSSTKFANTKIEPNQDGTVLPKIINTRTITSEVFERGAEEMTEVIVPVNQSRSLLKPPKSRIKSDQAEAVRGVQIKTEGADEYTEENKLPKILNVRSMADTPNKEDGARSEQAQKNKEGKEPPSAVKTERSTESSDTTKTKDAGESETSESDSPKEPGTPKSKGPKLGGTITVLSPALINKASTARLEKESSTVTADKSESSSETKGLSTNKLAAEGDATKGSRVETEDRRGALQDEEERAVERIISKPPPLARIPQRILNLTETQKTETGAPRDKPVIHSPRTYKSNRAAPYRIALNGPLNSDERAVNFLCHLCNLLIDTSWPVISAHYRERHAEDHRLVVAAPRLLRMSQEFIDGGYKELLGNKKRKSEAVVPAISKRRRRWTPKKHAEPKNTNSPGLGLCVEKETAEDGEGNFKCKKCNQRCTDMANLREHIASNHRINSRNLICLECGENFVVAPSLQMHLKAFHGIEDPIIYMSQNTLYAPESVDEYDLEGRTADANQCYVCMAVFEDKAAVDKHLRVHGMAFLNRRMIEARNALKSPEKPSKPDEERQNAAKESPKESAKASATPEKPIKSILDRISASI